MYGNLKQVSLLVKNTKFKWSEVITKTKLIIKWSGQHDDDSFSCIASLNLGLMCLITIASQPLWVSYSRFKVQHKIVLYKESKCESNKLFGNWK